MLFIPLIITGRGRYKDTVAAGKKLPSLKETGQMLFIFALAAFGLEIFRAPSMTDFYGFISTMFSPSLLKVGFGYEIKVALAYCAVMLVVEWIFREKPFALDFGDSPSGILRYRAVRWAIYIVLFVYTVVMSGLHSNFIYFQF